ncbi:MAG: DUF3108 domain-containing protein [Gammaproteobacteria bacterium]|nr:MAG: DUF3108 domain-containing protein [Gammaproteobacteria bacterium]
MGGQAPSLFQQAYEAHYVAERPGWWPGQVEVIRTLKRAKPDIWQLTVSASDWLYARQEWSRFNWSQFRPRAMTYHYRRDTLLTHRMLDAVFDWPAGRLEIDVLGERWYQPLREGSQDVLTCQLWIRLQVASGNSSPSCFVTDGGPLQSLTALSLGQRTVHWEGTPRNARGFRLSMGRRRVLDVWLVPSLNYMPVDMRYDYGNRDILHMRLKHLSPRSDNDAPKVH